MHLLRLFFQRITDDLKQKKLIPLKILFFVHASTLLVLYPYLTIHMRELGINVEETAIMSAVTPVVSIVMPPLAGMLADKIGNFKFLLALSSVLGGASALLLLAVPVGRITVTFPSTVDLLVSCDGSTLQLDHVRDYPCQPVHPYAYDVNLTVLSCGFVCELPSYNSSENVIHKKSYDVHLSSRGESQRLIYRNSVPSTMSDKEISIQDHSNSRLLTSDPFFNSTISKVSDNRIFFPTPQLYDMNCSMAGNITCEFGEPFLSDTSDDATEDVYRMRIYHDQQTDKNPTYWVNSILNNNSSVFEDVESVENLQCYDKYSMTSDPQELWIQISSLRLTKCSSACAATVPRKSLCSNQQQQIEKDPSFTFWAYLAVRVFIGIIGGTAFAMFEGAVIAIVRDQKADYGLQRLYGSIGGMISSPLSGLLIDYASRGKGYTDFRPAFYLYAVLKILSGVLMMSIDLKFKQPAQNLLEDFITVFRNIELVALFTVCFVMGTAWGYIESFLFWLLQDLGASRSLMGVTITVGGVAGLPLLVLSGPIIKKIGHANVLFIGFVFYAIRLLGYSLIYNPWLCLIFEALESVTSSLAFTAAVTYAARLSSTTTDTSVQGLLGGIYYGVGKGAGSLVGGYLMKYIGTRPTYQVFAGATFITGCIYWLFNQLFLRRRSILGESDTCKKAPAADIECCDTKNKTSITTKPSIDDATKTHLPIDPTIDVQDAKLVTDNVDGSSDSGVDNPAYTENEMNSSVSDVKKNENKI